MSKPKDFKDLTPAELYRSAVEDFALPVEEDEKGKKKVLLSAFVEGGVSWADYLAQHPEARDEDAELKADLAAGSVITSNAPAHNRVGEDTVEGFITPHDAVVTAPEPVVQVAAPQAFSNTDKYLIKMVRENPLYETRGYRFTTEHPYALVSAADAQSILSTEEGFRQAYPSELEEFYG